MAGALNVAELIAARAAAEPVRPALLHSGGTESYGELLARADMIAARLRPMLHGPAPRVAPLPERPGLRGAGPRHPADRRLPGAGGGRAGDA
jgi:non-ribosomal peptide synthetase component F